MPRTLSHVAVTVANSSNFHLSAGGVPRTDDWFELALLVREAFSRSQRMVASVAEGVANDQSASGKSSLSHCPDIRVFGLPNRGCAGAACAPVHLLFIEARNMHSIIRLLRPVQKNREEKLALEKRIGTSSKGTSDESAASVHGCHNERNRDSHMEGTPRPHVQLSQL